MGASILAIATTASCDRVMDTAFHAVWPRDDSIVVLSQVPMTLSQSPIKLTSAEPLKILGEWTSVCLVLRDGVPMQSHSDMERVFTATMSGAKVDVVLLLDNGSRIRLAQPMQGWSRTGQVLRENEMSACASSVVGCAPTLPVGATVKAVEVSASPTLSIKGIYWHSMPDMSNKPRTATSELSARTGSGCKSG